jgi:hypothetical protein
MTTKLLSLVLGALTIVMHSDITVVVSKASSSVVFIKGRLIDGSFRQWISLSSDGIATNLYAVRDLKSGAERLPTGEVYHSLYKAGSGKVC